MAMVSESDLPQNPADERAGPADRMRRILAAVLSAAVPGIGHFFLHKKRHAIGFLLVYVALGFLYWPVRAPKSYWGLIGLAWCALVLCAVAAWNALRTPSHLARACSKRWFLILLPIVLFASVVHTNWLLRAAGFGYYSMPSVSMEPTIKGGDKLIGDLEIYPNRKPQPGAIILFGSEGVIFVKRVIANAGSTIEGRGGDILIDGKRVDEPYVQHTRVGGPEWLRNFGPVEIPAGKLFVMGDNRDYSFDSRSPQVGLVSEEAVLGQALYIVQPLSERTGTELR